MIELNKEEILSCISRELLAEKLAEKIYNNKVDYNGYFNKEMEDAIWKAARKIVDEAMKEYELEIDIKRWLNQALKDMSKQELLDALTK